MNPFTLNPGDSCNVANPPAPCLGYVGEVAATQPDNLGLWLIFLVGVFAGFAFAFVTFAGPLYKLGKADGYAQKTLERAAETPQRPLRDARYNDAPGHPENMP